MRPPRRPALRRLAGLVPAVALVVGLTGCSGEDSERTAGDPVTSAEAGVLAQVLSADREQGGADFVVSAPFGDDALLTLTGEVDFAGGTGRAQALTSFGDGQPDQTRTVFFTGTDLWQGDVPGLADALAAAGLPAAGYARRPLVPAVEGSTAPLLDTLVQLVLGLSTAAPDGADAFADYTWTGIRSIDGEPATLFTSGTGAQVAVAADSDLLVQYSTELPGVAVTVTLSDHGEREISLPADTDTVDTAEQPELAAALGL